MSGLKLITAPAEEPISIAEAKGHLRETSTGQDALIQGLIIAAREYAETYTRRRFITQTWELLRDCFPAFGIEMPNAPLLSVVSITYLDTAGQAQVLDQSAYLVDIKTVPGRISPAYGEVWPPTIAQMNAVTIQFTAGYGAAAAVPQGIKAALQILIQYFEQRDANAALLQAAERVLAPYRVVRF